MTTKTDSPSIWLFGASQTRLKSTHCLIYRTHSGVLFEYHNFTHLEEERVKIFTRLIDDLCIKKRRSGYCSVCKKTDFAQLRALREPASAEKYYDAEEVHRVNIKTR